MFVSEPPTRAPQPEGLLIDLRRLIDANRARAVTAVNVELVLLYWSVGNRIHAEILGEQRADYGAEIVATVSRELSVAYGRGFTPKALWRMVQCAQAFPDPAAVRALANRLTWSHLVELLPLERPLQREFYAQMCRLEGWSVRVLRERIGGMLYERTALSREPETIVAAELARLRGEDHVSAAMVLKDPYLLDFLGLPATFSEADLEAAILRELESFLIELGGGFCFVERQKRMSIGDDDYYLDLLFYHRRLRRLVAVELKLGRFTARDKGQVELYLRWLELYERMNGEEPPIAILLCAGRNQEQVELLELDASGIHVAEYLTVLPPREVLEERLRASYQAAERVVEAAERET
jgi:predicted nuclease of restriction endonuclease-like (RecB) superfamily